MSAHESPTPFTFLYRASYAKLLSFAAWKEAPWL
jgi:hypothetical protein